MLLSCAALVIAAIPARLFYLNLRLYQEPPAPLPAGFRPRVSVLIPARNEERTIRAAVESVLVSEEVELEVIVLNDHSDDATAAIVGQIAKTDARVRVLNGPELPDGWSGKQYACWNLAKNASFDWLLFVDADVRLAATGLARMAAFQRQSGADLVSGIPFQETRTLVEKLVIPIAHFLLLGFLPFDRMRAHRNPAYGAGCGQLFFARRSSYEHAGGHGAIRSTLHDGLELPRAFRRAGLMTDLCDATPVATCRMYRNVSELWRGLTKNAIEGLGAPGLIVPSTLVLLLGQVLPVVLLGVSIWHASAALVPAVAATASAYYPRLAGVRRFGQPLAGALLNPVGVLIFLAVQWYSLFARGVGRPRSWKGRVYVKAQAGLVTFDQAAP
jgi:glycosyltransferase involved in cell wall biosynthesis